MINESAVTLAIQVGDKELETFMDVSAADAIKLVAQRDERIAASLEATERRLAAIREEVVSDPDLTVEYYTLQLAQSQADEVIGRELEIFSPEEQTAKIDRYRRYTKLGTALLYQHVNFGGRTKFLTTTWPNLSWWPYRFNDTASSAKAWGANILFQHLWYRGRRLWLVGVPYFEAPDFHVFDFNDRASSYASVG